MSASTALLITGDLKLAETVRKLIEAIPNLRLHQTTTFVEACRQVSRPGAALILAHLVQGGQAEEVTRVLKAVVWAGRRPSPGSRRSLGTRRAADGTRAAAESPLSARPAGPLPAPRRAVPRSGRSGSVVAAERAEESGELRKSSAMTDTTGCHSLSRSWV
jgi:hypothetical protein